jgi:MoaA/NifB/PqqE/SkfB family radical SAM enzyme
MSFAGVLDSTEGGLVRGWAFDSTRPDAPVRVTLTVSTGWRTTVTADQPRPDLLASGFGNGAHGFVCRLPVDGGDGRSAQVAARIEGSEFELRNSPAAIAPSHPLQLVAGDIVSNCNLRCPFCIVDYENIRGLRQMPLATFVKSLTLLPLVPDGAFWLSCMHEPTMHAEFPTFLEAIPPEQRRKVSFTTNLCRPMSDETLQRIGQSGVHSIRVSFDSLTPALFAQLRKGGRFEVFIENLRRVAQAIQSARRGTLLHVISMAFRDNHAEIPELVRRCREEFGAAVHEVRFMYYAPHLADWGNEHMLTREQWDGLKATLGAVAPHVAFGDPSPEVYEQFRERRGLEQYQHPPAVFGGTATREDYQPADPLKSGYLVPDEDLRLRMRWDGLLMIEQLPEWEFRANILDLPDPVAYFRAVRSAGGGSVRPPMPAWSRRDAAPAG